MTLQRIVGAAVLSLIFLILAALLLRDGEDEEIVTTEMSVATDELMEMATPLSAVEEIPDHVIPEAVEITPEPSEPELITEVEETILVVPELPTATPEIAGAELSVPTEPEAVETAGVKWFLQIASFSQQENAKQLVQKLKQKDIIAKTDMVIGQTGQLYRVRTIPQTSKNTVEQTADKIKQYFDITPQLLRRSN
jgi:cell division septation protein DedD